ncbi:ATP-binding protein [Saccharopolyspora shandongensis]|uniref:ATP-binding protein n=1 Tax=Saccharopolyspora shandongensis TaxID=418495 RepID=UPI0033EA781A
MNRRDELAQLDIVLDDKSGNAISGVVIAGTAGSGKTSLALSWAHRAKGRFPGGQLYINLRGYDPGQPISSGEALSRFLSALGVPPGSIPQDVDSAAALYRSLLDGRKVLVVLDNAATVGQVRPLLPGNPDCLVLVTSRSRLSGLAVRDGARRITLGTLPQAEAVNLLRSVIRDHRGAEDDARTLDELAELCGRLPLALRIAAERAASNPYMRLNDLIADLRDESALWEALSTGDDDEAEAVRTVFAWSYRALPAEAARLFRLLGLHPGAEFGLDAAAALAGLPVSRARQLLDSLVGAHLLQQVGPDRYEFHDLLRAYAADQATHEESGAEQDLAIRRILEWYLRTTDSAQSRIRPSEDRLALEEFSGYAEPLVFHDYDSAVDWAEKEYQNILGAIRLAAVDREPFACRLAIALWNVQPSAAPVASSMEACEAGIEAARRSEESAIEAELLMQLGMGYTRINRLSRGMECYLRALDLWQAEADRSGEASAVNLIGLVHLRRRELDDAAERFANAFALFREERAEHRAATALSNLASTHYRAGNLDAAAEVLEEALAAHRSLQNSRGVGNVLRLRSELRRELGDLDGALESANEALEIAIKMRDQRLEGYWLIILGDAQRDIGQLDEALASYQRSAMLHRRLQDENREAMALRGTGHTYRVLDRPREAAEFFRRAVTVHHELGDPWNEALARDGLGAVLAEEAAAAARQEWAQARDLLAGFADPRAAALRTRLHDLLEARSSGSES